MDDREYREELNAKFFKEGLSPDCRECGQGMNRVGSGFNVTFWYCDKCDAMILESQESWSVLYMTGGDWT